MTKRQFIAAIAVVLVIVLGAVVGLSFFLSDPAPKDKSVGSEELTAEDTTALEIKSSTFLQEAANFGINMDTLTDDTVAQRMEDIANDNGGTSWTKRADVAGRLVTDYVDTSGDFRFDLNSIANADYVDGTVVAGFKSGPISVEADKTANYVYTNRDEPALIAKVKFSGSSTLSHFTQSPSGEDKEHGESHDMSSTPWEIREQTVPVSGSLSLSRDNGAKDWKIRSIDFDEGEFAFPFWTPSAKTTSYPDLELDGTVARKVNFPSNQESTDGSE